MHQQNLKNHILHKSIHDSMSKIYFFHALTTFGKNLIGIFVPVYLFKIGYSISSVVLYSILFAFMGLVLLPLSFKLIQKIGFKLSLIISIPIYLIHILVLNYVGSSLLYFNLAWFTYGLYALIFWPAFHIEVAYFGNNKSRTSEIGTIQILSTIFGTLAPLIAGFVLETSSYYNLFILTSVIILIATIPLIFSEDIKVKQIDFSYKKSYELIKNNKFKNTKNTFKFDGINHILSVIIWPIILFILLKESFFKLGSLITVLSFFSVILMFYLKNYFNENNKEKYFKIITKILSLNWFFKSLLYLTSFIFLIIVEIISKLGEYIYAVLFNSIFYNNLKNKDYFEYLLVTEIYFKFSKILFGIFVICILSYFGESIQVLSFIALFGILASYGLGFYKVEDN